MRDTVSTDALWASALIDLATSTGPGAALDRVVRQLSEVLQRETLNSRVYVDASVAHFVRMGREQRPTDLLEGLALAAQAVRLDSASSEARFNLALFLERLHLVDQAAAELAAAISLEKSSLWRTELEARLGRLRSVQATVDGRATLDTALAGGALDSLLLVQAVRTDLGTVRAFAFERLLPEWGEHVVAGAASQAARRLAELRLTGRVAALHGDSIVLWVSTALDSLTSPRERVIVAGAFVRYADGEAHFRKDRYDAAGAAFRSASRELSQASDAGGGAQRLGLAMANDWITVRAGLIEIFADRLAAADSLHAVLLARSRDKPGAAALAGQAHWGLGISAIRRGKTGESAVEYESAAEAFAAVGDRVARAAVSTQLAQSLELSGLYAEALRLGLSSLGELRSYRSRRPLMLSLLTLGSWLESMGALEAAIYVYREAVSVAGRVGTKSSSAEAGSRLARALARSGASGEASAAVAAARRAAEGVSDPLWRPRFEADLHEPEGYLARVARPSAAVETLTRAIDYYEAAGMTGRLPLPLRMRAEARLTQADTTRALEDLDLALRVTEGQVVTSRGGVGAAALRETRAGLYRQLVAIRLARQDTSGAFAYAERARLPLHSSGGGRSQQPAASVAFTVLADRLLQWTRIGGRIRVSESRVEARVLSERVARFENALRGGADLGVVTALATELFALVLGPAMAGLPDSGILTVAPDGVLQRIPFASLRNPASGRYLVEDYTIALSSHSSARVLPSVQGVSLLLVDASGFSRRAHPDLSPLPSAASEREGVRRSRDAVREVGGSDATRERLLRELPKHGIFHFIGHARSVEGSPDQSHLVTVAETDNAASGLLTGRDLASLDLRAVQLVVLSSCGTVVRGGAPAGGIGSLARAFLLGGAGMVVSSIWEAEDRATALLMERFHEELVRGDPAEALRRAQLSLLSGSDAVLRAPGAWAAFRAEH
jgi:CHAT domain-containing protein/tetratricopeptide (TPR) repeat protein